jgi:hypothetical protein
MRLFHGKVAPLAERVLRVATLSGATCQRLTRLVQPFDPPATKSPGHKGEREPSRTRALADDVLIV